MISRATRAIKMLNREEQNAYAMLSLSLFSISILGFFAIRPSAVAIAKFKRKLEVFNEADIRLTRKIKDLNLAKKNLLKNQDNIKKVLDAMPSSLNQEKFVRRIDFLATKRGLSILQMDFLRLSKADVTSDVNEQEASIKVKGSYKGITNFIKDLLAERRVINVEVFSIRQREKTTTGIITVKIYFLRT